MTNVFAVVGEHRRDRGRLLLRGEDGCYYAYGNRQGEVLRVQPGQDWMLDSERDLAGAENERPPHPSSNLT